MSAEFIEAIKREDLAALKTVPKTDCHNHSFYGTRIERVEQWSGVQVPRPPALMNGLEAMKAYARHTLHPYLNTRAGFEFTAEAAIRDAIDDGVTRLEMSCDARFALFYPDQEHGLIAFLDALRTLYRTRITFYPELGFSRGDPLERETLARRCLISGFFAALDLYGDETAITPYQSLVQAAKQAGMKVKAHVGEFGSAALIRQTVEAFELDAVQHGIRAAQAPEVMQWLGRHQIPLHICPTSNVMLGSVDQLAHHPIRILYDHGVWVTINTDDLMIFGQSVSEEYLNLYRAGVLSAEELDDIRERALYC